MMAITMTIRHGDKKVAQSRYEPGFLVDIKVDRHYSKSRISLEIDETEPRNIQDYWPQALDEYFNSWTFKTDSRLSPNQTTRYGCANEHKTLFLTAARLLQKSLEPLGYAIVIEFS
ncbi:MAG: hypothetical protein PHS86_12340 [Syntrophaceae bacterium]|nr:hypothetical protein [Syntrophaceae bacterium]